MQRRGLTQTRQEPNHHHPQQEQLVQPVYIGQKIARKFFHLRYLAYNNGRAARSWGLGGARRSLVGG